MLKNKYQISNISATKRGGSANNSGGKYQKYKVKSKDIFRFFNFNMSFWILIFGFWFFSYAQEQFTYDAKGKRNPFIPLVTPDGRLLALERQEGVAGLLLNGIIYDKYGISYAIVNGEVVGVGDKVGDYQVLKIEEKRVIFIKEGELLEVKLEEEEP